MTLDELIRKRLISCTELSGQLADYAGSPAVFLQTAPADTQPGWDRRGQYPRIVTIAEMRADNERKTQGLLRVDLYCDLAVSVPEDLEPLIRMALKDIVMKPADSSPFCLSWQRTDAFELESRNSDKRIAGYEVLFDIVEFPDQSTADPDPVLAMNEFLKQLDPDMFLVGYDRIEDVYEPEDTHPAVYVRAVTHGKQQETFALVFATATLAIHVIAPSAEYRLRWSKALYSELFRYGEIPITDGPQQHPMMLEDVSVNNRADYLKEGQVTLKCMYTMLSARVGREQGKSLLKAYF